MSHRAFVVLCIASALITFDGTAVTVALPAIGRELNLTFSRLQWIPNAQLLTVAALLLPAGALADRIGRGRVLKVGLLCYAATSGLAAWSHSDLSLIAARALQGGAGALLLPSALALMRTGFNDRDERTRRYAIWAAWTGGAGVMGPLVGAFFADFITWRGIFGVCSCGAAAALLLLDGSEDDKSRRSESFPFGGAVLLAALLAATAYLLIEGGQGDWRSLDLIASAAIIVLSLGMAARTTSLRALLPSEVVRNRNCVMANAATFAFYCGVFGIPFLVVMYTQQVLGYSALMASAGVLPVSLMLLVAERVSWVGLRIGTKWIVVIGSMTAALGIGWMANAPHPVPFWSYLVMGTFLFGAGLALVVSSLTHAAVASVSDHSAGIASGLHHATVRVAGLMAIALLGSIAAHDQSGRVSTDGFRRAMLVCSVIVGAGGITCGFRLRDEESKLRNVSGEHGGMGSCGPHAALAHVSRNGESS
jgi:MFS family permease